MAAAAAARSGRMWVLGWAVLLLASAGQSAFDYKDALSKSILFYEAQRSGRLPTDQRAAWRSDSALLDGKSQGVDLVGGYYDAGDNVKFGLPMAFTITMMSWSAIEFHKQLQSSGQLGYTLDAIKWGADYLVKAHPQPNVLWGEVGDGFTDHFCWQRPEDMTTPRKAYKIDASNPGSDLAGETAAALAAASIVFRRHNAAYANNLLAHSKQLFQFADTHRGKYDASISVAQKFYNSKSGYADELLWAALWLHQATHDDFYLSYAANNAGTLGGLGWDMKEFSWDVKYAGVQVLASKVLLQGRGGQHASVLRSYQSKANFFLCACLQKNGGGGNVQRTPGGLLYVRSWNNMQYVTGAAFLLTVYSDYLASSGQQLQCPGQRVGSGELLRMAQSQVDYILGDNPRATSYMVGFGANFPQEVHHRASSIVSYKVNPSFVSCRGGYATWYKRRDRDPNILTGAVVGGPDQNDNFADERDNFEQTEPAIYTNGPLMGVLARLHGGYYNSRDDSGSDLNTNPVEALPLPPTSAASRPDDSVELTHETVASWLFKGQTYYKYAVNATNASKHTLSSLNLRIDNLQGPLWGLTKTDATTYTFPEWLHSLSPHGSLVFVYIQPAAAAKVQVLSSSWVEERAS
ncbi:endoglucanase 6 isoform X2 [Selaginella moellendorffii]|uniref:endoglucanase 6 isoform X2 n=1 Tax=Selaginella moellendorffii TaxID=88036 RepID=UPI000D1C26A6|nr:endoglucanase 6 isoform X2 [Selaginella moellendorffii]|eukprot:XP_024515813.1 endoglucanase 6 isoform X2 [Selaginella moellendorffii]